MTPAGSTRRRRKQRPTTPKNSCSGRSLIFPLALLVTGLEDGRFLYLNRACEQLFECTASDVLGKTTIELDFWVDPAERARIVESIGNAGAVEGVEARIRTLRGNILTLLLNARALTIKGTSCAIWSATDLTERHRAEDAAEEARGLSAKLIETTDAIVVGLDSEGKIQFVNRAFEEITGYSRADLEERNWFETLVPRDRYPQVWEEFQRLTSGGMPSGSRTRS